MSADNPEALNPFISARESAKRNSAGSQDRNRLWWERMPMTYADWDAADRMPRGSESLKRIEEYVLATGPFLKAWLASLDLDGKRCLDLGSGSGIFSCMLAKRGGDVTAVDLTEAAVQLTRQTVGFFNARVDVIRGDAEKLPFPTKSFDFVYSWGVLHHTSDMAAALKEVGRILRPGGSGIMMVYHRASIVYYVHGLFWLLFKGKIFRGHSLESVQDFYTDGYYHRYLTKRELGQLLDEAGLEVSRFSITQYQKKILPLIPASLDRVLKERFGMCLVAEFANPS